MKIKTYINISRKEICIEKCNVKNECISKCISTPPTLSKIIEFLTNKADIDNIERRTFRGAMECLDSIVKIDEKLAKQRVFYACSIPVGRRQWQEVGKRIDQQKLKQEIKQVKRALRKLSKELSNALIEKHGCYVVESTEPYSSVFSSLIRCLDTTECRWRLPFRVLAFRCKKHVDEPPLEVIVAIGKRSIMVVVDDYGNLTITTATMACSDEDRRIQVLSTIIEKLSTLLPPSDFEQVLREIATKLGIEEIRTLGEILFG